MRKLSGVIAALLVLGGPGCVLDRVGIGGGGRDGGGPSGIDAGPPSDGGASDAGALDAGDAGALDGGALDAGPPDAGTDAGPPDAGLPPLCSTATDLVACYPFDGDAQDYGPRGNHLTATGVMFPSGGGVALDAASGLSIAHRNELVHASTTMVGWVRVDTLPASGRAGVLDRDGQYGIFVHPGGELRCSIATAASGQAIAAAAVRAGEWHHVACVAEGTTLRLYVDGVQVATAPAAASRTPGASPLHLGENAPDGNDQLVGALDDVRIYDAEWDAPKVIQDAQWGRSTRGR